MKRLLVLLAVLVPLSLLIVGCGLGGSSPGLPKDSKEQMEAMKSAMKAQAAKHAPGGAPSAAGEGGKK
jgi:hypothetical protein